MNHTIAQSTAKFSSNTITSAKLLSDKEVQQRLMSRILSSVIKLVKYFAVDNSLKLRHQSFIEANLLDENLGREISRTLRR